MLLQPLERSPSLRRTTKGARLEERGRQKPFRLLRWFSLTSLAVLIPVAGLTGFIFSRFVTSEALQRDAALTAEFIQNCIDVESSQFGARVTGLAQYLDPREDPRAAGITPEAMAVARANIYEHLEKLPDVLVTSVYARDGRVVWSTNKNLIGSRETSDALEQAFDSHAELAVPHDAQPSARERQRFVAQPSGFFVENYVPLANARGEVVAVAEVYKEPRRLTAAIRRGQVLVWCTTLAGGLVIWLSLFGIMRRASRQLERQEQQLVESESLVFMGELATALAHSLRNPLGCMRTSAELAAMSSDASVKRNAQDIISQVDFLSRWVNELLMYSRPLTGEPEPVDLRDVVTSVVDSFRAALDRGRITAVWDGAPGVHAIVQGNATLLTQALHSVVSNAVEAMPDGGELRVELREAEGGGVELVVGDNGVGMSKQQLARAFNPFHTTKSQGLGIGLPMLKRAVERFGGTVTLSSTERVGTEARLRFRS